jgi:predicted secreted protein
MTRWIRTVPAFAILGICLAGGVLPRESQAGETVKLTEKDNGRREPLRVKRGDKVQVVLGFQPGTGYRWKLANDTTALLEQDQAKPKEGEEVDEKGERLDKNQQRPGRPGQFEYRLFHFVVPEGPVAKAGSRNLKLILARPSGNRAGKTFSLPIEVN